MKNLTHISSSLEDYLEAIADLIEKDGHAHSKELAARLQVKMPSVTNALQALAARDLIVYQPHQPVVLTASGTAAAQIIRNRHICLQRFFAEVLALSSEEADATACKVEHVIDENILKRLDVLTAALQSQPAGVELAEYLKSEFAKLAPPQPVEDLIPLSDLEVGESATIVHISAALKGKKKFADMGLIPGTVLEMEGDAPFGDLLRVRVLDSSLSLRSSDARYILVVKK